VSRLTQAGARASDASGMKALTRSWLVIGLLLVAPAPVALAQGTPDGVTPAAEDACTGLMGAAFGLCVAYCEANDCDLNPDSQACDRLRGNYAKITGTDVLPCEVEEPSEN
jgi:hypothetical protein